VLLFAHTDLSISGFNLVNCDAFGFEGLAYKLYYTLLGYLAIVWIAVLLFIHYRRATAEFKKQIILIGIGIEAFLFLFTTLTFIGTYLTTVGAVEDSRIELYGLFGMTFFMVMLGVLVVRFKTFSISIIAPQALVIALLILEASQFTFIKDKVSIILTSITLVLTALVGLIIVRSVKKKLLNIKRLRN